MSTKNESDAVAAARRRFLAGCSHFSTATPPVVTLVLTASRQNFAVAASGAGPKGGGRSERGERRRGRHHRRAGHGGSASGDSTDL